MKILLRHALPSDYHFIFATYLRHNWFNKDNKTTLKRSTWSTLQHKRLETILEASSKVTVACLSEDPDTILGYGFQDGKDKFVYVKKDFRAEGLGVDKMILKELK